MQNATVFYDRENDIGVISLNRPKALNSENIELAKDLLQAVDVAAKDPDTKVVLLRGEGRSFCAGGDNRQPPFTNVEDFRDFIATLQDITRGLIRLAKPTIAVVQGYAAGGGCELAMACDLRIASEDAQFGFPEVKVGGLISNAGTYLLPRIVGLGKALELVMVADYIDAQEAHRIGFVNKVVPREQLESAAREIAARIGKNFPTAVRAHKIATYFGTSLNLEDSLSYEVELACANWATGAREAGHETWRKERGQKKG